MIFSNTRQKIRHSILNAVDNYGRYRSDRFKVQPDPKIWDLDVAKEGHIQNNGIDLVEVAESYGTPLHIVDGRRLEKNFTQFLESFSNLYHLIEIGASYKTNPVPAVINKLHQLGASAEVISHFELWLALRIGVPPKKIIFNGPGKTRESLRLAIEKEIKAVNIDSHSEIPILADLASDFDSIQKVGIRVVASVGWAGQFGLPIANGLAWEAVKLIQKEQRLELKGLHIHLGTGIKDVAVYLQAISEVLEFAQRIEKEANIRVEFLDFGGGFGVPTVSPYTSLDHRLMAAGFPPWPPDCSKPSPLPEYAKLIIEKVKRYYDPAGQDAPTLIFEPGRAITSSAQILMLKVLTVKSGDKGEKSIILDGGRNIIMPPVWEHHAIFPASKMNEPGIAYYNIYGPLCHPGDLLFRGRWLPETNEGDYIAIMDTGAYFIPNQMNFSNPRAPVAMIEDKKIKLIREHESFENMVALDCLKF